MTTPMANRYPQPRTAEQNGQSRQPSCLEQTLDLVSGQPLLRGKVIILTGAAGGIGRVTAQVLVAAGASLTIVDREGPALRDLAELLIGDESLTEPADASDSAAFRALTDRTVDRFGALHGLINCAGLWDPRPVEDITAEAWSNTINASLQTAFAGCQAALPGMIERGSGSIVNFASTAGEYGSIRPAAHYAAAKAGVIGLTKSLAREAGASGVRVNAISPGPVDTAALLASTSQAQDSIGARTLLGRLGRPEEIAAACVFLLSDLSSFVTGHVLRVNGGALL